MYTLPVWIRERNAKKKKEIYMHTHKIHIIWSHLEKYSSLVPLSSNKGYPPDTMALFQDFLWVYVWTLLFIFVTEWSLQQGSHLFRRPLFTWLLGWSFIIDLQSQKSVTQYLAVFTVKWNLLHELCCCFQLSSNLSLQLKHNQFTDVMNGIGLYHGTGLYYWL